MKAKQPRPYCDKELGATRSCMNKARYKFTHGGTGAEFHRCYLHAAGFAGTHVIKRLDRRDSPR